MKRHNCKDGDHSSGLGGLKLSSGCRSALHPPSGGCSWSGEVLDWRDSDSGIFSAASRSGLSPFNSFMASRFCSFKQVIQWAGEKKFAVLKFFFTCARDNQRARKLTAWAIFLSWSLISFFIVAVIVPTCYVGYLWCPSPFGSTTICVWCELRVSAYFGHTSKNDRAIKNQKSGQLISHLTHQNKKRLSHFSNLIFRDTFSGWYADKSGVWSFGCF